MNVILQEDLENLGFEYEVVSVKPGYARNYLIPNGLNWKTSLVGNNTNEITSIFKKNVSIFQ